MTYKISVELVMSDRTMQAIKKYDLNIPELAICAIRDEVLLRSSVDEVVESTSPMYQNAKLRQTLAAAHKEIALLRSAGYSTPDALKVMVRS